MSGMTCESSSNTRVVVGFRVFEPCDSQNMSQPVKDCCSDWESIVEYEGNQFTQRKNKFIKKHFPNWDRKTFDRNLSELDESEVLLNMMVDEWEGILNALHWIHHNSWSPNDLIIERYDGIAHTFYFGEVVNIGRLDDSIKVFKECMKKLKKFEKKWGKPHIYIVSDNDFHSYDD
jgi:hypothetical protein